MADTSSIASRMEKLAKLKRMKLERATVDNTQDSVSSATESPSENMQETPIVTEAEAPISLGDERHMHSPESYPLSDVAEDDTAAELGQVNASDDVSDYAPNMTSANDAVDDGLDSAAIHTQIPELDDYADIDGPDLDTELPTDLLDIDETSEMDETVEAINADTAEFAESGAIVDDAQEAVAIADISETDINDEILSAEALGIDEDETSALDEVVGIADINQLDENSQEVETPNFAENEIDPTTLEREFEHEAETQTATAPKAIVAEDGKLTLTFDSSRSTLLSHVSRQMDCSPEDVVVTALDWYLDALFGEENDEAKSA